MTNISRDIFKAIHEGKWLQLEYRNKQAEITHYWFAIENIDIENFHDETNKKILKEIYSELEKENANLNLVLDHLKEENIQN